MHSHRQIIQTSFTSLYTPAMFPYLESTFWLQNVAYFWAIFLQVGFYSCCLFLLFVKIFSWNIVDNRDNWNPLTRVYRPWGWHWNHLWKFLWCTECGSFDSSNTHWKKASRKWINWKMLFFCVFTSCSNGIKEKEKSKKKPIPQKIIYFETVPSLLTLLLLLLHKKYTLCNISYFTGLHVVLFCHQMTSIFEIHSVSFSTLSFSETIYVVCK